MRSKGRAGRALEVGNSDESPAQTPPGHAAYLGSEGLTQNSAMMRRPRAVLASWIRRAYAATMYTRGNPLCTPGRSGERNFRKWHNASKINSDLAKHVVDARCSHRQGMSAPLSRTSSSCSRSNPCCLSGVSRYLVRILVRSPDDLQKLGEIFRNTDPPVLPIMPSDIMIPKRAERQDARMLGSRMHRPSILSNSAIFQKHLFWPRRPRG